jgi:RNA polymerase sigma-70 factor (ECF subfamily)
MCDALPTTQLLVLLERLRGGDLSAWDEVSRHLGGRLEQLARRMLRGFPGVRRWEQPDDVLQQATLRLLRALREAQPPSTRAFFGLAALQIRRELLDLARHYGGPEGPGSHHHTPLEAGGTAPHEPLDPAPGPAELEEWCAFHAQIQGLPEREREVVDLHFYQGVSKAEVAGLLGVDVRTVQRLWNAALQRLQSPRRP